LLSCSAMTRLELAALLLLLTLAVALAAYAIHSPLHVGFYSDITSLFYAIYVSGERWFEAQHSLPGAPYVDYHFEYPPLVGLLWLASTETSFKLCDGWMGCALQRHFEVQAALSTAAYAAYVAAAYKLASALGAGSLRLALSVASPSMLLFLDYNWDVFAAAFLAWSACSFLSGRAARASLLLSLSSLSKLLPAASLPGLAAEAYKRGGAREALGYTTLAVGTTALGFALLYAASPAGFWSLVRHHEGWYCENCFYILLTSDLWNAGLKAVSKAAMVVAALATSAAVLAFESREGARVAKLHFLPVAAVVSFSYVYSPQMNAMLAPLFLLAESKPLLALIAAQDSLNAIMMLLWFANDELFCQRFGLGCSGPWTRESPVQWVAFARILLLWAFVATSAASRSARRRAPGLISQ